MRIDCASLEGPKINTEEVRDGFIRIGKKSRETKIALHPASHAGPASYSESCMFATTKNYPNKSHHASTNAYR